MQTKDTFVAVSLFLKTGNYLIENNVISTVSSGNCISLGLVNSTGSSMIINNTFIGGDRSSSSGLGIIGSRSEGFMIANNLFTGADDNSSLLTNIAIEYGSYLFQCSIVGNRINISAHNPDTSYGILVTDGLNADSNLFIGGNIINISPALAQGVNMSLGGFLSGTLRDNQVISFDPAITPSYDFNNGGGATLSQINFTPDNIGLPKYEF